MKLSPERRQALRVLWAALLGLVVYGSWLPPNSEILNTLALISDKLMHFCAYTTLAFLPVLSFESRRRGIITGALMVLVGLLVEAGQSFVGRDVELGDVIANTLGVCTGIAAGLPLRRRLR